MAPKGCSVYSSGTKVLFFLSSILKYVINCLLFDIIDTASTGPHNKATIMICVCIWD